MSYTINLTNGNIFATILPGNINQASSMTLIGKNYAGYGQFLDDNFIHLLENGANSTPPLSPLVGQLWFNTTLGSLQVYNGTGFKALGGATASATAPANNTVGDLWFNTTTAQLNVWTGTAWIIVGPIYTSATGVTGAIPTTIIDGSGFSHVIVELYVGGSIVGIISKDATVTPAPTLTGFTSISPGIQLSTSVTSAVFTGTASNASAVGSITAAQFMRSDIATSTTGTLTVNNNTGLIVGTNSDFNVGVVGTAVNLTNNDNNGNINFVVNKSGTPSTALTINGSTGIVSGAFGITANYADVAERFAADEIYEPGTVVELGGSAEITKANIELSDSVFGVISTKAAYLMNNGAGDDLTHPPVAMTGRVPVQVIGIVNKGDRLVSAGNGVARSAQPGEATAFNVIGRALVSKTDLGPGTVEAIVTIK